MSPRERRVEVAGLPLHVVDGGRRSERAVVALHGFPGADHMSVRNTPGFENLEQTFRVVYYDQRGTGHSVAESPGTGGTFAPHVEDLDAIISTLALERPLIVGHDAGATVGLAFAVAHPAALSGLILVSPRLSLSEPDRRRFEEQAARMLDDDAAGGLRSAPESEANIAFRRAMERIFPFGFLHFGLVERTFMKRLTFRREGYDSLWTSGPGNQLAEQVSGLRVPCMVMTGRYDPWVDLTGARELAQTVAGGRFHLFHNSAHWPFLEEPQEFSDVVCDWAEEVAAHIV